MSLDSLTLASGLEWAFRGHLTPFFKNKRPSKLRQAHVIAFSDHEIVQRSRIAALRERGKYLVGPNDGMLRELSDRSINNILAVLTELLTWAAQRGWGDPTHNPASGWRLKVKPRLMAALERDELYDLILAAGTPHPRQRQAPAIAARAELIVRLRDDNRRGKRSPNWPGSPRRRRSTITSNANGCAASRSTAPGR